ncbi:hypothetical protein [Methanosarcina barkeri]|nr:hypothetical protein [Methanosarcina barkeri]
MIINPMAIGIEVAPIVKLYKKTAKSGKTKPKATPINIARKIHRVK